MPEATQPAANLYAPPRSRVADPGLAPDEPLNWTQILFSFKRRIPRKAYWLSQLPIGAMLVIFFVLAWTLKAPWLRGVGNLLVVWPAWAVAVKRWHDHGDSGWWNLLVLIPIVNIWVLVKLGFLRGADGPNRFGPDPTGRY